MQFSGRAHTLYMQEARSISIINMKDRLTDRKEGDEGEREGWKDREGRGTRLGTMVNGLFQRESAAAVFETG